MIIRTATFRKLHGHLDIDLSFKPGINILIGTNGSGKTSVLNAMAWTLSPHLIQDDLPAAYLLSTLEFEKIQIAYKNPGSRPLQRVTATRSENVVTISVDRIGEFNIPTLDRPRTMDLRFPRTVAEHADYIARFLEGQHDHPVLQYLNDLTGPLYLPLNRRWAEEGETGYRARARRSTTIGHLPISQVVGLAQHGFRQEQTRMFSLNDNLRNRMLTSLFEVGQAVGPSRVWTLAELTTHQSRVDSTLENLGLTDARQLSERYFERLRLVVTELEGQVMPSNVQNHPHFQVWLNWIVECSPIANRIEKLIPLIESYESDRIQITRRSSAFLESVNSFIEDSNKEIGFFNGFDLSVKLPTGQEIESSALSSGELQLLILFTFLYFLFDPNQEFPVFVDEPELSLHLAWQRRYVESVREANPKAQLVIATHSPEIVGSQEDAVIDMSRQQKRQ